MDKKKSKGKIWIGQISDNQVYEWVQVYEWARYMNGVGFEILHGLHIRTTITPTPRGSELRQFLLF